MSKIICDVCGTSYPETSTHCPICGCVRAGDARPVSNENAEQEVQNNNYTYVKGGRFSKSNVKKHNTQPSAGESSAKEQKPGGKKKDTGILVAVILLLLAIVAVVIFIALRFFAPAVPNGDSTANTTTTASATSETTETTVLEIPCVNVTASKTTIEFEKAEAALLLNVTTDPVDTTDIVVFASTDEKVATVTADGKVTAVGPGQAVITITCGQAAAECRVVCNFETEPAVDETEPSSEATSPSTPAEETFKLNWYYALPDNPEVGDVTLTKGEKWTAYLDGEGKVKSSQIVFSTSDAAVIVIDNTGVATAVGVGEAYVYAKYNGQTLKCRVMVR